jgi:hypothetical protein
MTARLTVIACPSLKPELEMLVAEAPGAVALVILEMALHEKSSEALRTALQAAIDATHDAEAIAIAYGLCNRGTIGLVARDAPLVLPRTPDCLALLLGSRQRYADELAVEPGTYFETAGWLAAARDIRQPAFTFGPASNVTFERLAARYGDEAAAYLQAEFEGFTKHYKRLAYIATADEPAREAEARALAEARGLSYQRLAGDTGWLKRLIHGDWADESFLVVPPGHHIIADSEHLIGAAP